MGNTIMLQVLCLLLLKFCYIASGTVAVQEKAEAANPLTTTASWSPPEGNTTFLDGTTWCIANGGGAYQIDLQNALDWACGLGMADCRAIQNDGPCFEPDTLVSHASYAFNYYYQQNGNSDIACNFGGTATLSKHDPSYGKCIYSASRSMASAATSKYETSSIIWWTCIALVLENLIHNHVIGFLTKLEVTLV